MNINGTIINADVSDIVSALHKQCVWHNGLTLFNKTIDSGDDLMVQCPYHKDGQERKPSAGIRKSDGQFHCLACGETHSLPEVIAYCFGYKDALKGYKWLIQNFATTEVRERERINVEFNRDRNNANVSEVMSAKVNEEVLDSYRYTHNYLYERGLTDEVIEEFDLGYDKATDCITFPVRDINGDCIFVARRSVKTKYFDLPKGITKPLYGMYELSQHILIPRMRLLHNYPIIAPEKVYVCEGLFDCLRLWCVGKFAVAGFGCLFNTYQVKQLQDLSCRTIVLALDNDDAGWKANKRLRQLLTNKIIKEVVLPEGRKDIGECTDDELLNLKEVL